MPKRENEHGQLRREDYDYQMNRGGDDDGDGKEFKRADTNTLRKRRIISVSSKFKKKSQNGNAAGPMASTPAPVPAPSSNNAFAGFTGLTNAAPAPAKASNPFAGFTGLTNAAPAPAKTSNPFAGFTGLTANMGSDNSKPKTVLGFPAPADTEKALPPQKELAIAKPFLPTPANEKEEKSATLPFAMPVTQKSRSSAAFNKDMVKLNESFAGFVKKQVVENPHSVWVEAAKGYLDYVKKLEKRHGVPNDDGVEEEDGKDGVPVQRQGKDPSALPTKPSTAAAGAVPTPPAQSKPVVGFQFGASNPAAAAAAPAPAFGGFKFGGGTPAAAPAPGGFSFTPKPLGVAATSGGTTAQAPQAQEDEGDAMPPEEATVVERNAEEDATESIEHEVRSKLYQFDKDAGTAGEWKDMGVGVLRLMKHKETKKSRILMRNSAGKISLNTTIFAAMKFDATAEKGTIGFVTAVQSGEDQKPKPVKFLLKVKKDNFPPLHAELQRLHKEAG